MPPQLPAHPADDQRPALPRSTCPVVVDDTVVFRDQHHLTATFMAKLAEPIGNLLDGRPAIPLAVRSATTT